LPLSTQIRPSVQSPVREIPPSPVRSHPNPSSQSIAATIHSRPISQNPITACSELLKPSLVAVAPAIAAFAMFAVFTHTTIIATTVHPSARNPAATTCSKLPGLHLIAAAAFTSRSPSHFSNEANSLVHVPQVFGFTLAFASTATLTTNAAFTKANLAANATFINADLVTATSNITTPAAHAAVSAVLAPAVHAASITAIVSAIHTPSSSL
jgi:hypothetical protein